MSNSLRRAVDAQPAQHAGQTRFNSIAWLSKFHVLIIIRYFQFKNVLRGWVVGHLKPSNYSIRFQVYRFKYVTGNVSSTNDSP